ncbi:PREDICTED: small lysine-rich protein 1, partial [Poecilia mexicana]
KAYRYTCQSYIKNNYFLFSSKSKSAKKTRSPKTLKKKPSSKCNKMEVNILSCAAVENLYYMSHNAPDCLECRGFGWPNSQKKGTKQKKRQIRSAKH